MMFLISIYIFILFHFLISFNLSNKLSDKEKLLKNIKNECSKVENKLNEYNNEKFKNLVKLNFELFLCNIFNGIYNDDEFKILLSDTDKKCFRNIEKTFENNSTFYYDYLSNSGSRLDKIGNEKKCIEKKLEYILIEMYSDFNKTKNNLTKNVNNEEYTFNNEKSQHMELNGFLENDKFYLGLCLWKDCNLFYEKFFNKSNQELFQFLKNYHYTAIDCKFVSSEDKNEYPNGSKILIIIAIIFVSFIIFIRCILFLSNYCTEKNQQREPDYFKLNPLTPSPDEMQLFDKNMNDNVKLIGANGEIIYDDINVIKELEIEKNLINKIEKDKNDEIKRVNTNKSNNSNNDYNIPFSSSDSETRGSRLTSVVASKKSQAEIFLENYKFISFQNLYLLESKSFNSKNLEEICGFKFFLLLSISFYNLYDTFYKVKWNSPGTIPFYKYFSHILLVKLSKMSFRIWIFFEGFEWGFKLLSYIKKLKTNKIQFRYILIFNMNLMEKIIVFIIIFFVFIWQLGNFGQIVKLTSAYYMHSEKYTSVKCYKNPLYILILPILGYYEEIGKYEYCYNFIYILVNELYSIIICSILFYFFFKFRSKNFETFFLVLLSISILLSFIYFNYIKEDFYYKRYVLGEDLSHKSIGLFFHYFFIGCISGLVYYYSTVMNLDLEQYNPFERCYRLLYSYNKMDPILRHFFSFFCLFLIGIICSYYPILCKIGIIKEFRLIKKVDFFTYIVISYENIIQILLFMIFFFDIILTPEMIIKIFL